MNFEESQIRKVGIDECNKLVFDFEKVQFRQIFKIPTLTLDFKVRKNEFSTSKTFKQKRHASFRHFSVSKLDSVNYSSYLKTNIYCKVYMNFEHMPSVSRSIESIVHNDDFCFSSPNIIIKNYSIIQAHFSQIEIKIRSALNNNWLAGSTKHSQNEYL